MLKPQSKYPFTIHTFHSCPRLNAFCTTSSFWGPSRDLASWIFSGKGMLRWESSSFTKGSQDFSKGSKFRGYCLSRPSMDGFKEKPTGNHRFPSLGRGWVCHLLSNSGLTSTMDEDRSRAAPQKGTPWSCAFVLINTFAPSTKISTYLNIIPSTWHRVFAISTHQVFWLHTTSSLDKMWQPISNEVRFQDWLQDVQADSSLQWDNNAKFPRSRGPVSFLCVPSCLLKSSNDCEKKVNHDNHGGTLRHCN